VVSRASSPSQFSRVIPCESLSNLECRAAFVTFSFCKYLDRGERYQSFPNWEWIKTLCLMTMLFFMCFFQIIMTHVLVLLKGIFPNKNFARFTIFLKTWDFFNDMSNNNIHATLMICISLWRKIFHHGNWFRRWPILHWVKKKSNTCLKSLVWIFSTWTKMNTFSLHHDSHKWFLIFLERYLSLFPACLIKMDFSRHVIKIEFHGYQRKKVQKLKWCIRVFMGLGSLSLIYALSSSFAILSTYTVLSKTFVFRSWDKGSF
jgi:hypothetical protein